MIQRQRIALDSSCRRMVAIWTTVLFTTQAWTAGPATICLTRNEQSQRWWKNTIVSSTTGNSRCSNLGVRPILRRLEQCRLYLSQQGATDNEQEQLPDGSMNSTGTDSMLIISNDKLNGTNKGQKLESALFENDDLEQDGQFGIADGAFLEKADNTAENAAALQDIVIDQSVWPSQKQDGNSNNDSHIDKDKLMLPSPQVEELKRTIKQLTQPRSFPLFLMEKAAELVETTAFDATQFWWEGFDRVLQSASDAVGAATGYNSMPTQSQTPVKERVVVLGTGWGAISFLQAIDSSIYDVTVVSPRNHFVFTPLLAGASVGTVSYRSVCEPIQDIVQAGQMQFLEAAATGVDPVARIVHCASVAVDSGGDMSHNFTIPYDRLLVTVGAQSNTFGIPGVKEHCLYLRTVENARRIRNSIIQCFEVASLPQWSDIDRQRLLTFAVIGAGPTGIEFAAELRDFVEQDGPKYYPDLIQHVRIKVIEAMSTVLASFDKSLQQEAIRQLQRPVDIKDSKVRSTLPNAFQLTELLLDSSVKEIDEDTISLNNGRQVSYGLAIWAGGNGPIPITLRIINSLGAEQMQAQPVARGRLAIDPWMRVVGGEGRVFALGDCSCITGGQVPATAQVASQQGEYLANLMNRKYNLSPPRIQGILPPPQKDPMRTETTLSDAIASLAMNSNEYAKPFQFLNLGILAYTGGGSALAQITPAPDTEPIKGTGAIGNAIWRSVYLTKQISMRNRLLVMNDWTKRQIFNRDVSSL